MTEEQYTEIEKEAQKWLDETDCMQFSQMELLSMFHFHAQSKLKNNGALGDVSQQSELLLCGVCDEDRSHLIINDQDTKCLHCGHVAKP
jgi:hypothetical protein